MFCSWKANLLFGVRGHTPLLRTVITAAVKGGAKQKAAGGMETLIINAIAQVDAP